MNSQHSASSNHGRTVPQPNQTNNTTTAMEHNGEQVGGEHIGDVDEPPERKEYFLPFESHRSDSAFVKSLPPQFARRESLLTRQLHYTEPEHHEDEHHHTRDPVRGMSTWSNPSVASTADLISDNDLTSPGTRNSTPSPPYPSIMMRHPLPILTKEITKEPVILEETVEKTNAEPEKVVEATLGRPRCISFACGKKTNSNHELGEGAKSKPQAQPQEDKPIEPVKRKCTLTFACPTRPTINTTVSNPVGSTFTTTTPVTSQQKVKISRNISPAPQKVGRPLSSPRPTPKAHRGSDVTLKNESPKSVRKMPAGFVRRRKYSADTNDIPAEERRFHEFGPSEEEAEQWLEESGCYRNRLTVNDTLLKENIIRQIGEEAEEEAREEEEEAIDEDDEDDLLEGDDDEDEDEDAEEEQSEDAISDAGFDTDDEEGFAVSDDEGNDSETEWWAPGRSTAATSTDHLEHIRTTRPRTQSQSSMESADGEESLPRIPHSKVKRKSRAMKINRPGTPELPDSTDFVCGTLDEDRPLEQAYISCLEQRKAAKHKARPQDIDPTFPTSDPEMEEEDDDDEDERDQVEESDHPFFMQGQMDMHHDEPRTRGRRTSLTAHKKKSPSPPHQRLRSPPPAKRVVHRSPPPPIKRARSPAPVKRNTHRSPPPRLLFGQSPHRNNSPAPLRRVASPAPSRRTSNEGTPFISFTPRATLGQRPQPTHTASLPRVASAIKLGNGKYCNSPDEYNGDMHERRSTRGAIDIVKGLEKKRQRRKEKLYQKHCNRAVKEPQKRPKPGKGAERMREVGLELAAYRGKKEHMLSY